jgi:hypothetical protein
MNPARSTRSIASKNCRRAHNGGQREAKHEPQTQRNEQRHTSHVQEGGKKKRNDEQTKKKRENKKQGALWGPSQSKRLMGFSQSFAETKSMCVINFVTFLMLGRVLCSHFGKEWLPKDSVDVLSCFEARAWCRHPSTSSDFLTQMFDDLSLSRSEK